ncbi:MAG: 1-acyl-sn-glycerol-3-phosphate acyltransferase, partial [Pseudomonadota bacterium]
FMRRSFRGDALYAAVFNEYLYQVYRRGHSVEFFPEGGRTRSGRLLPAKFGLLKMTVDHQLRGLPKPLAFVPVYFSYEKVIEGSSYLSELRGATKKRESLADVFRNIKLIRQNFGRVGVNLGAPIELDRWLAERQAVDEPPSDALIESLGRTIMRGINEQATVNPVNLVALVTLAMTNSAIEEQRLLEQITCYQQLLSQYHASQPEHQQDTGNVQVDMQPAADIIAHVEQLGLLHRYSESFGDVLGHEPFAAVLMTWYRNNVVHTLALPSLVACLVVKRRRPIRHQDLHDMVRMIFPYLAQELSCQDHKHDFNHCVAVMCKLDLLIDKGADGLSPPAPDDHHHQQLSLLANLVSHTLERMYIVIQHLSQGGYTRESLQDSSELVAQKISRLYGINAPEFSDRKLFDQFINQMLNNGIVTTLADGTLTQAPAVDQVLQAAESVIDPQIRFGVLNASTARSSPADPPAVVEIRSTGSD